MKPRILVVGDFKWRFYEPDFCEGLVAAGAEVHQLPVLPLFGPGDLLRRAQSKYLLGPGVVAANAAVVAQSAGWRPDCVLLWRTSWVRPQTIDLAKVVGARKVVLYNNDDPFGPDRELRIWRRFRKLIPRVDVCFSYRKVNVPEYQAAGAHRVEIMRSWFNPRIHHPWTLTPEEHLQYDCDVVFIGHREDDSRVAMLERLMESGLSVRIFGTGWDDLTKRSPWNRLPPIRRVLDEEYAKAIAGAKVALVFLSTRNRDDYTRRCFEIPAIGTAMLAPRTEELRSMFAEDEEAAYFGSSDELLEKARLLVRDDAFRTRIAAAGRERLLRDGHDPVSRARQFLTAVGLGS